MIPFIPWQKVSAVLAGVCVALGLWVFVQGQRLDAANARRDMAELDIRRVAEANGQAISVVERLRAELEACVGDREALLNRFRIAEAEAQAERERIAAAHARRIEELRTLYANDPNARAWADVRVPDAVASQLYAARRGAP